MKRLLGLALALGGLAAAPVWGYVDNAPTLGKIINDSSHIVVLQIDKVNRAKRVIIYKKVADLKGQDPATEIRHQITDGAHHREAKAILDWAESAQKSGKPAVCFHNGKVAEICLGNYWYECTAQQAPWWSMTGAKPELALAFFGSTEKLRGHVTAVLAGKEVVITAMPHGQNGFGAYFHMAFRTPLGAKDFPVQRVRASLKMPGVAYQIGTDPQFFVGLGAGDAGDVPPLIDALKHKDARLRTQAADDLGMIGPQAKAAVPALAGALTDAEAEVRLAAAASLAKIDPGHQALVPALRKWFMDGEAKERWAAAEVLGQAGPEAAAAVPDLVEALKDKTLRGAAADALGGIGPKARSAVAALVEVLKDEEPRIRWSAAVALARLGGPGTKPAVPILIEMWQSNSDYWNVSLYLGALGPEAKEAVPLLLKNVDYFAAWSLWSIEPQTAIPYLGQADIANDANYRHYWSSAYFRMVGPRTKDMAVALTEGLRDGKVGPVASWATGLIAAEAGATVPILIDGLKDKNAETRRRSAAVLGTLGSAANDAIPALNDALKDADAQVRQTAERALKQIQGK
jgi:HEAT repeat protein